MGRRYWAITIKRAALGFAVIFLFGVIYDYNTNTPDYRSPFLAGGVAILIYILISLVVGFLNLITGALYLWLFADKDLTEAYLDDLRRARFRRPGPNDLKTDDYLISLADDPDVPTDQRLKAATFIGAFEATKANSIFRALALSRALNNAILRYSQEAPES